MNPDLFQESVGRLHLWTMCPLPLEYSWGEDLTLLLVQNHHSPPGNVHQPLQEALCRLPVVRLRTAPDFRAGPNSASAGMKDTAGGFG